MKRSKNNMKPLFFSTLKALAVFAVSAAVLLLILCFIALRLEDPASLIFIFSNIALLLSAFLGGRFSVNKESSRFLSGLTAGLSGMLIILLVSLINSSFDGGSFLRMALTVLLFVLGAFSKSSGEKSRASAKKRKNIAKRYASYR